MLKRVWGQTATTGRFTGLCCWEGTEISTGGLDPDKWITERDGVGWGGVGWGGVGWGGVGGTRDSWRNQ